MLELPWRSSSQLQCLPILAPLIQQRVADEEVFGDPWKQIKVHLFRRECHDSTMILKSLKILLQNARKNTLIVHSLLETQNCYDIILIQEPPWSEIRKVPSSSNSKGDSFIGTIHHPNWIMFGRVPMDSNDSPRVISYVNICLSPLCFLLRKDIINHRDINLISFFNDNTCLFILNIYSDSSHTALKYLKDTEVNIGNILIMTGDFNIRDRLWDPLFPHHSTISGNLFIIANLFNLSLSNPTNPCPTRYSDMPREANSILDLMFLHSGSPELDSHCIFPENRLSSNHAPLSVKIPIIEEVIQFLKFTIPPKSDQDKAFIDEVISNFKSMNTNNIDDVIKLDFVVKRIGCIIDHTWRNHAKKSRISKHSKQW